MFKKKYLTIKEAAHQVGCTQSYIYYLIQMKQLVGYKKRGKLYIEASDLDEYFNSYTVYNPNEDNGGAI